MALAALVYERVALLDRRLPQSSVAICAAHEIAVSWRSYRHFRLRSESAASSEQNMGGGGVSEQDEGDGTHT